jgi:hypothetical protein
MHAAVGLSILICVAAFVFFAFRQGTRVRPDDRPDRGSGYGGGSDSGFSHHSGDGGGVGHG